MLTRAYKKRLVDDEYLIVCMHEHWSRIIRHIFYTVIFAAVGLPLLWFIVTVDNTAAKIALGILALGVVGLWGWLSARSLVEWRAKSYGVTTMRVLLTEGFLSPKESQVDLIRVHDPDMKRNFLNLLLGTGTIDLGDQVVMTNVPRVRKVYHLINQLATHQSREATDLIRLVGQLGYSKVTPKVGAKILLRNPKLRGAVRGAVRPR